MAVSAEDRRRWDRQVEALHLADNDEEGTLEVDLMDLLGLAEMVNRRRVAHGRPELNTEGELHRRARTLGLLVDVPTAPR